ncbi:UDP-N-acetylmuramate--L-alanine ligase [Pinibacter soli]|uniref:UDP-N-acetylmuramate--L-alanine ligase n=1 Tax=Pinibacter soli TaxID=3044211 RepID=A0ABT6R6G7_9BACT|nr:UDP-N-acetylmuramate--L-alanine ligase [Pinibacter soli]MDI3318154.1 UDP-N-acetylmuramate--L-alanine ligase [Pinibacter soli]
MIQLRDIKKIYFIGIGGIGMSAIARYFHSQQIEVSGYDKTATPLTKALEESGMAVHYTEDVNLIPKDVQLVVYTPAIPKGHAELVYYQQHGYEVRKRSEVLQIISEGSFNICIAGTHGKTTTTTMVAHLLRDSGYGCNAFLGGISVNYNTNFWSNQRNVCVIEADEYDRSFLRLSPDVAIITSMDADHLDIYGTEEALQDTFVQFSEKIKIGGLLISKYGLPREKDFNTDKQLRYSVSDNKADVYPENIQMHNGSYSFDVVINGDRIEGLTLHMGGQHNVENSIAAITVAYELGIEKEKIKAAIASFKGVKRRFEYIRKDADTILIDDYAHHPEELRALLTGAKSLFPDKKCVVVFQPHLYSRTNDLQDAFGESLDIADEVILLPIYPARELPIPGVSSEMILNKMKNQHKQVLSKEDLLKWASEVDPRGKVIITAGAGDIDALVEPIGKELGIRN